MRAFKLIALAEAAAVGASLCRLLPLTADQAADVVATATSMAGALWQMAAPGTNLRELYRTDPELAHAVVDVGPRLTAILAGLLTGFARLPTNGLSAACVSVTAKKRCTVSSGWVLWFAWLTMTAPSSAASSTEASSFAVVRGEPNLTKAACTESRHRSRRARECCRSWSSPEASMTVAAMGHPIVKLLSTSTRRQGAENCVDRIGQRDGLKEP